MWFTAQTWVPMAVSPLLPSVVSLPFFFPLTVHHFFLTLSSSLLVSLHFLSAFLCCALLFSCLVSLFLCASSFLSASVLVSFIWSPLLSSLALHLLRSAPPPPLSPFKASLLSMSEIRCESLQQLADKIRKRPFSQLEYSDFNINGRLAWVPISETHNSYHLQRCALTFIAKCCVCGKKVEHVPVIMKEFALVCCDNVKYLFAQWSFQHLFVM